jgi:conjugative transfer signal peptidase TraF
MTEHMRLVRASRRASRRTTKRTISLTPLVSGIIATGVIAISAIDLPVRRLIWNASASAPVGLYWMTPNVAIARGDLVLAWAPDWARHLADQRHYLPLDVPLVKRVVAVGGDRVCEISGAVFVNGGVAAWSLEQDRKGRILTAWKGCRALHETEVFLLMEGVNDSFDSRYFGPVETSQVVGRLVPIWTF